ncbi:protocadherin Fat 4 [Esox lucius]|uniref:protocadherin Fat 4 n=1 Tax=Esox lucius TaxID=8010 RepID=UPI0014772126|nr:protocadherin Fat 4 [Esox lucius]
MKPTPSMMAALRFIRMFLLSGSLCVHTVRGGPIGTSVVNCAAGSELFLGPVNENYEGEVEVLSGIPTDNTVKLEDNIFPGHINFLELVYSPGSTNATVQTKMALDTDIFTKTGGELWYSVVCETGQMANKRKLILNDLNDNAPVFEQKVYSKEISEIQSVDTTVIQVKAVDADITVTHNRLTYSVLAPAPAEFEIRGDGSIILKRPLNYNFAQNYNFTVEARDNGGLFDTANVLLEITDFDNLSPYFSHSLYQATIQENHQGPFQSIQPEAIHAQDGDTGINVAIVYTIRSVSPSKYLSNFNIDANTGVISVVNGLDREEIPSVTVSIKASQQDDSQKTADASVSVSIEDVNDNAPEFNKASYSVELLENSPKDTVIFRATVTDPDEGGFVGTFRIIPDTSPFSISSDGTVTVKTSADLDRETVGSFAFQIEARENNLPNHNVTADVNITLLDENDNRPLFGSHKYEGKVFKNQTLGMYITQVEAADADAGLNGQVKYSIEFGNLEGYFTIDENTGEIKLNKTVPLEENRIRFSLYVTAKDGGRLSQSSSVPVEILAPGDSKPQFLLNTYQGSIEEEKQPGVTIVKVTFLAAVPVTPVTLQVLTDADKFAIDSKGIFTSKIKLDYETQSNYSVRISISDSTSSDEATVAIQVVDINDNSPVFAASSLTHPVPEDTAVGANITAVSATDADDGFNGELRYALQGGEGQFAIDPRTGMVLLAGRLDRETKAEFLLEVVAQDQGRPARSATATLTIQVSDVNDNAPVFSETEYVVEVLETESLGKTLITLAAVDPDQGTNGAVTFSITHQDPPSIPAAFELNSSTGALSLAQVLDYGSVKVYQLMVQAADGGSPSLFGNGSVLVRVKDVNNNPPQFSMECYDISVSENLASGATIETLNVTDKDEGGFSNGYFIFTSDTFNINRQGEVSLKNDVTLDRETKDNYILQVVAVDQPTDGLNATAWLNITVQDYNDNTPQFPPLPDPIPFPEGDYSDKSPKEVLLIQAKDSDLGPNGEVTMSISSSTKLFRFREDGMLLVVGPLDRETKDVYELVIVASDNGTPQRQNITSIQVSVTDENDNAPVFSADTYSKSILVKNAKVGDVLMTLFATDRDMGLNALITYSFSPDSSPLLALNGSTGEVTVASDLSGVTEDTTIQLTAMAKDSGHFPLNSTAKVQVFLKTVSLEEGVAFESSSYNFSIPENEPQGRGVGTVKATSGNPLFTITYVLSTHTDLFSIDDLGALTAKKPLDRETEEWYILEVKAVDSRDPPTSAVTMVRVRVEDVNEAPEFKEETYKTKIFSVAPYKYPVVQVQATDLDIGERGRLEYSLSEHSLSFGVDRSTGQVYVVSAVGLEGQITALLVKATDPEGLHATTRVEVDVQGSVSSDVVVISLNRPTYDVATKVPEMEESLGHSLDWTVNVIGVSSSSGAAFASLRTQNAPKTYVSFIATDVGVVIPAKDVRNKLWSEANKVEVELEKVFGAGVELMVEEESADPNTDQVVVIALGVLFGLSLLGLIAMVTFTIIKFRRMKRFNGDPYKESFDIDRNSEAYKNDDVWVKGPERGGRSSRKMKTSQEAEPEFDRDKRDNDSDNSRSSAL